MSCFGTVTQVQQTSCCNRTAKHHICLKVYNLESLTFSRSELLTYMVMESFQIKSHFIQSMFLLKCNLLQQSSTTQLSTFCSLYQTVVAHKLTAFKLYSSIKTFKSIGKIKLYVMAQLISPSVYTDVLWTFIHL